MPTLPGQSPLARYPVVRMLVPYILGILLADVCELIAVPLTLGIAALAAFALMSYQRSPKVLMRLRAWWIVPLTIVALSLGWTNASIAQPPILDVEHIEGETLAGRIDELKRNDFSMRMQVTLMKSDKKKSWHATPYRVLLTTRGCDYMLQAGDVVTFQSHLTPIVNRGNPYEMDYARLMREKGMRYTQHTPVERVVKCGESNTLLTRMFNVRHEVERRIMMSHLSPELQHLLIAVTLGNDDYIDYSTRSQFAQAGIAHILALSGLHVSIIVAIIWFLLFPLDMMRMKKLRLVISMAALIAFAVFSGMSPSTVRATLMVGITFTAIVLYRKSPPINAVALAAFVILIISPLSIANIGFQLSFVTVLSLIVFYRPFKLSSKWRGLRRYVVSLMLTSLIALLSTLAITAHYFNTISWMSCLTNLLVLPLFTLMMPLCVAEVFLCVAQVKAPLLDRLLELIYKAIKTISEGVAGVPGSHWSGVYLDTTALVFYFIALALLAALLYTKKMRFGIYALCSLCLMLMAVTITDFRTPRQGLIALNDYSCTPVFYFSHQKAYLWMPDNYGETLEEFNRHHSNMMARLKIQSTQLVEEETKFDGSEGFVKPPFLCVMNRNVMFVGNKKWKQLDEKIHVDWLILGRQTNCRIDELLNHVEPKMIILSGALYDDTHDGLLRQCQQWRGKTHSLKTNGAVVATED